jgi:hypothetical protein
LNSDAARKLALEAATRCMPQHSWSVEMSDVLGKKILVLAHCFEVYLQNGYEQGSKVLVENVQEFRDRRRTY